MSERCVFDDYTLRGATFEVWTDGSRHPSGYPGWWLSAKTLDDAMKTGVPVGFALTGDEFNPPLTDHELCAIGDAILDSYAD